MRYNAWSKVMRLIMKSANNGEITVENEQMFCLWVEWENLYWLACFHLDFL